MTIALARRRQAVALPDELDAAWKAVAAIGGICTTVLAWPAVKRAAVRAIKHLSRQHDLIARCELLQSRLEQREVELADARATLNVAHEGNIGWQALVEQSQLEMKNLRSDVVNARLEMSVEVTHMRAEMRQEVAELRDQLREATTKVADGVAFIVETITNPGRPLPPIPESLAADVRALKAKIDGRDPA